MTILFNCIFGYEKMIIFYAVEWIKQRIDLPVMVFGFGRDRANFPVMAIRTRHEVTCTSYKKNHVFSRP